MHPIIIILLYIHPIESHNNNYYEPLILISTAEAVPCAIFAFLHECSSEFSELVAYAISLGGDTDTIGSMAGAIAGAYFGVEQIPQEWVDCCEESSRAISYADALFDLVNKD